MRGWIRHKALMLTALGGMTLAPLASAAAEEHAADLAQRCQACHAGGLALDRFDTASLIEKIGQVQNVPGQHAPLLADADAALIAALAERLAGDASE